LNLDQDFLIKYRWNEANFISTPLENLIKTMNQMNQMNQLNQWTGRKMKETTGSGQWGFKSEVHRESEAELLTM
jgi:hypothetical protein